MPEIKHTPGPWVLDGFNLSSVLHCTAERGSAEAKHLCGDFETIARCEGDNWQANARLIAAAPDLLAALKVYEAAWDDLFAGCLSNGVFNAWGQIVPCKNLNHAHDLGAKAVAKAEGRSNA